MIYLQLFWVYLQIGLFGFGGGYAMLSLIQDKVVVENEWLTSTEFADIVAISQMTPGPVGINSATYIGYKVTGSVWGSMLATTAVCLPSFILMVILCGALARYKKSPLIANMMRVIRPLVVGLIAAAALMLMNGENFIDYFSAALFAAAFVAVYFFKVNVMLVILLAGIAGVVIY